MRHSTFLFLVLTFMGLVATSNLAVASSPFGQDPAPAMEGVIGPPLPAEEAFFVEGIFDVVRGQPEAFVRIKPAAGYYVYQERSTFKILEPVAADIPATNIRWPEAEWHEDPHFGRVQIFRHEAEVHIPLPSIPENSAIRIEIRFQGCQSEGICYPPMKRSLLIREPTPVTIQSATSAGLFLGDSLLLMAVSWLGMGLMLAFTPCTLPALPLVHSLLTQDRPEQATRRVAAYVGGHTLVFAAVGMAAGLMGSHLTVWAQHPLVLMGCIVVLVLVATAQFGWWHPRLPVFISQRMQRLGNQTPGSSLLSAGAFGAVAALIVGPCVAPPLALVVGYLAQTGDPWRGGLALVCLSFGMGLPLLAMGTVWQRWIPKQGAWMVTLQRWAGIGMIALALWLGHRIWPAWVAPSLAGLLCVGIGLWGLHHTQHLGPSRRYWQPVASLLVMTLGLAQASTAAFMPTNKNMATKEEHAAFWLEAGTGKDLDLALDTAKKNGQPVILDFYADWCSACISMEKQTFADPLVRDASQAFRRIQVDITDYTDEHAALLQRFALVGPPATLFWTPDGREINAQRLYGFEKADDFVKRLGAVEQSAP